MPSLKHKSHSRHLCCRIFCFFLFFVSLFSSKACFGSGTSEIGLIALFHSPLVLLSLFLLLCVFSSLMSWIMCLLFFAVVIDDYDGSAKHYLPPVGFVGGVGEK